MLYSDFITRLRAEARDNPRAMHYDWTGDGSIVLFQLGDGDYPVLEDSYTFKINAVTQTEPSQYSLDNEGGLITTQSAPTDGHPITLDYKKVKVTDDSWLNIINYVIDDMEGSYFREVDDPNFGNATQDAIEYSGPTNCIDVVQFFYRTVDNASLDWEPVIEYTNWRYSKDENELKLGSALVAGYPMRLHYLKGFARGTAVTDTLDIQDRFLGVLQLGCMWRYYDFLLGLRAQEQTKASKEEDLSPLSSLREQSRHYKRLYEEAKSKKKPTKPSRILYPSNQAEPMP